MCYFGHSKEDESFFPPRGFRELNSEECWNKSFFRLHCLVKILVLLKHQFLGNCWKILEYFISSIMVQIDGKNSRK